MKMNSKKINRNLLSTAIAMAMAGFTAVEAAPATPYTSAKHIFTTADLQQDFEGTTFGSAGASQSNTVICGSASTSACPDGVSTLTDKDGTVLYPIDSEFGFYVVDYLGAQEKTLDGDYKEGYAGDILVDGSPVGIRVSNAGTDVYKVPAGLGTWCQGLGGTSVKCSTEHYAVMEHVLSCFETVPYSYADPITGAQAIQALPDGSASFDCANAQLNDMVNVISGGIEGGQLLDATPGVQLEPNDNTSVIDHIAASTDYSITLKDDGKALYRWGTLIKRPNDIRMYAKISLPEEWKTPGTDMEITSAKLVVKHVVTNNPNDQIRPEDLENEAAIGRLPDHKITGTGSSEIWTSLNKCYEGDGDLVGDGEDPHLINEGTVFRNMPFAVSADTADPLEPLPFSEDLRKGFTNAWYTTVDREPFEWSYRVAGTSADEFRFVSSAVPNPSLGELWSGPRWRLKPNKFGQDIPGLEIPKINCSAPPYAKDNIKYEVGAPVTTVINLLDWDAEGEGATSPLASTKGWVDITQNGFVTVAETVNGVPVSTNGLPMTSDFDLAVYVKGDRKPTSVYSAQLFINQEPTAADLEPYIDPNASTGGSGGDGGNGNGGDGTGGNGTGNGNAGEGTGGPGGPDGTNGNGGTGHNWSDWK